MVATNHAAGMTWDESTSILPWNTLLLYQVTFASVVSTGISQTSSLSGATFMNRTPQPMWRRYILVSGNIIGIITAEGGLVNGVF
jgi:hypothetical protein